MTPDRALHRDSHEDIEGLAHRGAIRLPEVILSDGTASPDQVATVPPWVNLAKAFLPYRELPGPPTAGPGTAIVGTREPDFGPYLTELRGTVVEDGSHHHITRPQSRDDILAWLFDITGTRYAPAALWRVAGWEMGWLANWLDRLLSGSEMGSLIVAERQAAAAVRATWIANQHGSGSNSPLGDTGILLAARAVIDMLAAFDRVMLVASHEEQVDAAQAAILQRLRSCIKAIEDAATCGKPTDCSNKVAHALDHAHDIVDSIGLFTVVGELIGDRVIRITEALPTPGRTPPPLATTFAAGLDSLSARLEAVVATTVAPSTPAAWCPDTTGDLSRLYHADMHARVAALALVRTDLVYKLVVTRRPERVFEAIPWMAAPSGAFPLTYGGPLGAAAAVFEVARYREIGVELRNRTFDSASGPRLDTRRGAREYGDPVKVRRALRLGTRAGFWLATSALSHHMVHAFSLAAPSIPRTRCRRCRPVASAGGSSARCTTRPRC